MSRLSHHELWYPGQSFELADEYPTPSEDELVSLWQEYRGDRPAIPAPGVYGVLSVPKTEPQRYASVDLCEVVQHTHLSMRLVEEPTASAVASIHNYCSGLSIGNYHDITAVAQVLMADQAVPPDENIDEMGDIMRRWRAAGVYIMANTSTLPGCEPGTIRFLDRYLPDCFDGLLLPRNHDSLLPLTKGVAATLAIAALSPTVEVRDAIHIDDKPPHNTAFQSAVSTGGVVRVQTFQPDYPTDCAPGPPDSIITKTPLQAFQAADRHLFGTSIH